MGLKKNKIFCISYPRTGTKSIAKAFDDLGYKSWHFNKNDCDEVLKVLKDGSFSKQILDFYDFFVDVPIFLIYKDLDKLYPESKFILITREKNGWAKSMKNMLVGAKSNSHYKKINDITWPNFCSQSIMDHTKEVKEYFFNREDDLLVEDLTKINYNILCDFLNIENDKKGFPHSTKYIDRFYKKRRDI